MKTFGLKKEIYLIGAIGLLFAVYKCVLNISEFYLLLPWGIMLVVVAILFMRRIRKIEIISPNEVFFFQGLGKTIINPSKILKIEEHPRHFDIYLEERKIRVTDWIINKEFLVRKLLNINQKIELVELKIQNAHKDVYIGYRIIFNYIFAGIVFCIAVFLLASGYITK